MNTEPLRDGQVVGFGDILSAEVTWTEAEDSLVGRHEPATCLAHGGHSRSPGMMGYPHFWGHRAYR